MVAAMQCSRAVDSNGGGCSRLGLEPKPVHILEPKVHRVPAQLVGLRNCHKIACKVAHTGHTAFDFEPCNIALQNACCFRIFEVLKHNMGL